MSFGIWLAFYVGLSFLVGRLYASFLGWKFVRLVGAPGMLLAFLGRGLSCLLTGNDVNQSDCWRGAGPSEAKAPAGGTFFRLLYSIAPFFLAVAGVIIASSALERPVRFEAELPRISSDPTKASKTFFETSIDFTHGLFNAIRGQELGNTSFWIYAYLAWSFVVACAPSLADLKAIAIACGVVVAGSVAGEFLGVQIVLKSLYEPPFWTGFSLLVAYTIFVLAVSAVLFLPVKLLRDSRKEK